MNWSLACLSCFSEPGFKNAEPSPDNVEPSFQSAKPSSETVKPGWPLQTVMLGFVVLLLGSMVLPRQCGAQHQKCEAQLTSSNGNAGLRSFIVGLHGSATLKYPPTWRHQNNQKMNYFSRLRGNVCKSAWSNHETAKPNKMFMIFWHFHWFFEFAMGSTCFKTWQNIRVLWSWHAFQTVKYVYMIMIKR